MTKEEAQDRIALYHPAYVNQTVYFEEAGLKAVVKSMEPLEGPDGEFTPMVYLDDPQETDTSFEKHIFSHLPLDTFLAKSRLL